MGWGTVSLLFKKRSRVFRLKLGRRKKQNVNLGLCVRLFMLASSRCVRSAGRDDPEQSCPGATSPSEWNYNTVDTTSISCEFHWDLLFLFNSYGVSGSDSSRCSEILGPNWQSGRKTEESPESCLSAKWRFFFFLFRTRICSVFLFNNNNFRRTVSATFFKHVRFAIHLVEKHCCLATG